MNHRLGFFPSLLLSTASIFPIRGFAETQPDNPRIIEPAKKLYAYLYELSASTKTTDKLITGHWCQSSKKPGEFHTFQIEEVLEMRKHSGKWIGLIDGWICTDIAGKTDANFISDYMWYDGMIPEYLLWWRNGGIVHAAATFPLPAADGYGSRLEKGRKVDIEPILTPGTPENIRWRAICERMSTFFKALEAENVPVIFRPFTEAYFGEYWYSAEQLGGGENFTRLYRDLYDYLAIKKNCNNILWDFQGGRSDIHYPGDAYVDIYTTRSEYVAWKGHSPYRTLPEDHLPMGIGELGDYGVSKRADEAGKARIPWATWAENVGQKAPRLCFYTTWNKDWGPSKHICEDDTYCNYDETYNDVMNHPYMLTRDELTVAPRPSSKPALEGAHSWIEVFGSWSFQDGRVRRTDAKGEGWVVQGNTDWTDYAVQAQVTLTPGSGGEAGVLGRCASADIFYCLAVSTNGLSLYRRYNDKLTSLGTWSGSFETGQAVTLKIDFRGDQIEGFVDTGSGPVKRIGVVDTAIPCGAVGLRTNEISAQFTEIRVSE